MLVLIIRIRGDTHSQGPRQNQSQSQSNTIQNKKCFWCGHDHHSDRRDCPAQGKACNKCGRMNHFEVMCGKNPLRKRSQSRPGRLVNELNQNQNHDSGTSLTSICDNSITDPGNFTLPKQVLDVVNLANSGNHSGKNLSFRTRYIVYIDTPNSSNSEVSAHANIFKHRNRWCFSVWQTGHKHRD